MKSSEKCTVVTEEVGFNVGMTEGLAVGVFEGKKVGSDAVGDADGTLIEHSHSIPSTEIGS